MKYRTQTLHRYRAGLAALIAGIAATGLSASEAAQIGGGSATPAVVTLGSNGQANVSVEFNVAFQAQDGANCAARLSLGNVALEDITIAKTAAKITRTVVLKGTGKQVVSLVGIPYGTVPACGGSKQVEVQANGPAPITAPAAVTPPPAITLPPSVLPPPPTTAPAQTPPTVGVPTNAVLPPTTAPAQSPGTPNPSSGLSGAAASAYTASFAKVTAIKLNKSSLKTNETLDITLEGNGGNACQFSFDIDGPGNIAGNGSYSYSVPSTLPWAIMAMTSEKLIGKPSFPAGPYKLGLKPAGNNPCPSASLPPQVSFTVVTDGTVQQAAVSAAVTPSTPPSASINPAAAVGSTNNNPFNTHRITTISAPAKWYAKSGGQYMLTFNADGAKGTNPVSCLFEVELINMLNGMSAGKAKSAINQVPVQNYSFQISLDKPLTAGKWRMVASAGNIGTYELPGCHFPNNGRAAVNLELSVADAQALADYNAGTTPMQLHNVRITPERIHLGGASASKVTANVSLRLGGPGSPISCAATVEVHRNNTPEYYRQAVKLQYSSEAVPVPIDLDQMMAAHGGFKLGTYRVRVLSSPFNNSIKDDLGNPLPGCLGEVKDDLSVSSGSVITGFRYITKRMTTDITKEWSHLEIKLRPIVEGPKACKFDVKVVLQKGEVTGANKNVTHNDYEYAPGQNMYEWLVRDNGMQGRMRIVIKSTSQHKSQGVACEGEFDREVTLPWDQSGEFR